MEINQPYDIRLAAYTPQNAADILCEVKRDDPLILKAPPVKPRAGDVFIYLSNGKYTNDWKCDQYRWANNGTVQLPRSKPIVKKSYYAIDTPEGLSNDFRKHVYVLLHSEDELSTYPKLVLIHYLGDEKVANDFPHGNQKKNTSRNYCQLCPSSLTKTKEQLSTTSPSKLYKTEIAAIDCHPSLVRVMKPRDIKQVSTLVRGLII